VSGRRADPPLFQKSGGQFDCNVIISKQAEIGQKPAENGKSAGNGNFGEI
jgi:hypothetical protein